MNQIISVWTHPRSVSTAFERMFIERGDHVVFHEPFANVYFFEGKKEPIERADDMTVATQPQSYSEIRNMILAESERAPVVHKDMAYHCIEQLMEDRVFLRSQIHTLLIRDPWKAIPSHAAMRPAFSLHAAGYEALYHLYTGICDATGQDPIILDADDILANPTQMVAAYCKAIHIPFKPDALNWDARVPEQWRLWANWHETASASTGFSKRNCQPRAQTNDPRVLSYIHHHLPYYEELYARRFQPIEENVA